MNPKTYKVNGKKLDLYTVGELANRVDRKPQTIRGWERRGVIPPARYKAKTGMRLYTEKQIEAIVNKVEKFDLTQGKKIPDEFKEEVFAAFKEASPE